MTDVPQRIWINWKAANQAYLAYDEPPVNPWDDVSEQYVHRATLDEAVEVLRKLIDHAHNCEKELTEELHQLDFCGESLPLTNARAFLSNLENRHD